MIIDCHTHILPGIDDGAKNLETSLEMLKEEKSQGVDAIIATPHFYAERDWIDKFIERREKAYNSILNYAPLDGDFSAIKGDKSREHNDKQDASKISELPIIKKGAEVAYFSGMSRAEEIEELCIEGTNIILVEMPFRQWDDKVIDEIQSLVSERELRCILVHVERFLGFKGNDKRLQELVSPQIFFQMNAECILEEGFLKKKKVAKLIDMFESGMVSLMGSDCHNMSSRKPNIDAARKKLSEPTLKRIDETSEKLFEL